MLSLIYSILSGLKTNLLKQVTLATLVLITNENYRADILFLLVSVFGRLYRTMETFLRSVYLGTSSDLFFMAPGLGLWHRPKFSVKTSLVVCCFRESLRSATPGQPTIEEVLVILLRECRKENIKYKSDALTYTTDVLQAYNIDQYKEISDIISPILKKVLLEVCLGVKTTLFVLAS